MAAATPPPAIPDACLRRGWVFDGVLGGGGQGVTLRVRNAAGGAGVLKLVRHSDRVALGRFRREIEVIRDVAHPSIVRLLDWDLSEEAPWYISPEGIPLKDYWHKRRGELDPQGLFDEALGIVRDLADALAVLHERSVIHRDVKPENVIRLDGRFVLIDFGLAIRPADDRLTEADGRPVANRWAAPAEAFYGAVEDPKPAWDCLGLAWLWAWLLGEGEPKYGRVHWRFHRFIADPRCEYVRAVLAATSVPEFAPPDGAALSRMINGLFVVSTKEKGAPDFSDVKMVVAREQAIEKQHQAEEHERAIAAAELVHLRLGKIYEAIDEAFQEAVQEQLPVRVSAVVPAGRMREFLIEVAKSPGERTMIEGPAGPDAQWIFHVHIRAKYHREAVEGTFPFAVWVAFETRLGDRGRQIDYRYRLLHDGRLSRTNWRDPAQATVLEGDAGPANAIRAWLRDPNNWQSSTLAK